MTLLPSARHELLSPVGLVEHDRLRGTVRDQNVSLERGASGRLRLLNVHAQALHVREAGVVRIDTRALRALELASGVGEAIRLGAAEVVALGGEPCESRGATGSQVTAACVLLLPLVAVGVGCPLDAGQRQKLTVIGRPQGGRAHLESTTGRTAGFRASPPRSAR